MRGSGYRKVMAAAFVLGGATGYLVGMLTAPASGEQTRREVAARLRDRRLQALRSGQQAVNRLATGLERRIEAGRRKLSLAVSG